MPSHHAVNLLQVVTVKNAAFPRSRFASRMQGGTLKWSANASYDIYIFIILSRLQLFSRPSILNIKDYRGCSPLQHGTRQNKHRQTHSCTYEPLIVLHLLTQAVLRQAIIIQHLPAKPCLSILAQPILHF